MKSLSLFLLASFFVGGMSCVIAESESENSGSSDAGSGGSLGKSSSGNSSRNSEDFGKGSGKGSGRSSSKGSSQASSKASNKPTSESDNPSEYSEEETAFENRSIPSSSSSLREALQSLESASAKSNSQHSQDLEAGFSFASGEGDLHEESGGSDTISEN